MRVALVVGVALITAAGGAAVGLQARATHPAAEQRGDLASLGRGAYTDPGNGCQELVSAIGYADDLLLVLGQERYQGFSNAVRSRLSSVTGTVRTEADDLPDQGVRRQALLVGELATRASRLADGEAAVRARAQALVEYREAAARLVLECDYPGR